MRRLHALIAVRAHLIKYKATFALACQSWQNMAELSKPSFPNDIMERASPYTPRERVVCNEMGLKTSESRASVPLELHTRAVANVLESPAAVAQREDQQHARTVIHYATAPIIYSYAAAPRSLHPGAAAS